MIIKNYILLILTLSVTNNVLYAAEIKKLEPKKIIFKDKNNNTLIRPKNITIKKESVVKINNNSNKNMNINNNNIKNKNINNDINNNMNNNINNDNNMNNNNDNNMNNNNNNMNNNKIRDDKDRNYELLLKLLVSDDKENMNIALTEAEIQEKKLQDEKNEFELEESYKLSELYRQKKLLPSPKKIILIGENRIVFADYTIYPYIPAIKKTNEINLDFIKNKEESSLELEENDDATSIIAVKNGDIFMNKWIVDKTTDSYILYKHLYIENTLVKKYMLNKD